MEKSSHLRLREALRRLAMGHCSHRLNSRTVRARSWLTACLLAGALVTSPWSARNVGWFEGRAQAAASSPGLSLSPSFRFASPSATFTVDIVADCGANADAAAVKVAFDPTYLQFVSLAPDLSKFSNKLLQSYDNSAGRVEYDAGAALTCHESLNCPSGSVRLATITFRTVAQCGLSVPLSVEGKMTWAGGYDYIFNGVGSGSTVGITIAGDVNLDRRVDIVDIMLVATRWNTVVGDPGYDVRYDLAPDMPNGAIDIVDIMYVAARWNQTCSGGALLAEEGH